MRKLDEASKTLFVGSVVADTLRLVKPELAALLDLDSIEALPTEYVGRSEAGEQPGKRFADSVFRINFKEGCLPTSATAAGGRPPYLLVASEFQHANDAAMLDRVREYADWQDAHYRHLNIVRPGEHPALLALVFHTGSDPWSAPDGLEVYRALPEDAVAQLAPHQRQAYIRIEAGKRATLIPPQGNRLGAVMRLTGAATGRELLACLLQEWRRFGGDENSSFRRGMREWTQQIMLGFGASSVELPEFEELERAIEDDRMEYLLEDHIREWRAELHREGIAQGVQQGIAQGVQQGIAQGVEQGIAQGERNALERLAERRFGADAAHRLSATLNGTPTSRQRLDELADLIVVCRTTEEFVGKLGD